jgi:glycosyltransferase involved in cell wall biosynthesis
LVIHEAFMAGVPVVGAAIGGIRGLVDHGRSGFLYEPRAVAELSMLLSQLVEDPDQLNELSLHLPRVKSIREDADEWEDRYESLIEKAVRPAELSVEA